MKIPIYHRFVRCTQPSPSCLDGAGKEIRFPRVVRRLLLTAACLVLSAPINAAEKEKLSAMEVIPYITAKSSSDDAKNLPTVNKVLDGSGMRDATTHELGWRGAWVAPPGQAWIVIDLMAEYPIRAIHVWNINSDRPKMGMKDVEIFVSSTTDEKDFVKLETSGSGATDNELGGFQFPMGLGRDRDPGTRLDLSGIKKPAALEKVRLVKIQMVKSWGENRGGLSEVRFGTKEGFVAQGAPARPPALTDLTRGDKLDVKYISTWNMGPTGIVGVKVGGNRGDQILVTEVLPGSPADGKVLKDDVVMGIQGKDFVYDGNLDRHVGEAIIKAEEEAGKGKFEVRVWRAGEKSGGGGRHEFPLQLQVMGTYSDSSPFDCPVADKIRQQAWQFIAKEIRGEIEQKKFTDKWRDIVALVASNNPEYRTLAREWAHAQPMEETNMGANVGVLQGDKVSWSSGFRYLEMAIYQDATGDDIVMPTVRKLAIQTALGQDTTGTWGHNFTWGNVVMNPLPGYGAVNATGGPCFFFLALAQRIGVKEPVVDEAVERSRGFFGTFVDRGVVPYGVNGPIQGEDSNGKNFGPAYAFHVLGDAVKAKFYGMNSAAASFARFGGHGSPVMWYNSPLTSHIVGRRGITDSMRNMRFHYTLARRHDGSFVLLGDQFPGINGAATRSPTATTVLHYSLPLKGTVITGKDANPEEEMTAEDYKRFQIHARRFVGDPVLIKQYPVWQKLATPELIGMLNHHYPTLRGEIARELGKRFLGGQTEISGKLVGMLAAGDPRARAGACAALRACGGETYLAALPQLEPLFSDPREFVRIAAVESIAAALPPSDLRLIRLVLTAVATDAEDVSPHETANLRQAVQKVIFPASGNAPEELAKLESPLVKDPFSMGMEEGMVRRALSSLILNESGYVPPAQWTRETVLRLAGPLVLAAKKYPWYDKNSYVPTASAHLLAKHGFREAYEADADLLRYYGDLPWTTQRDGAYQEALFRPAWVDAHPGAYKDVLPALYTLRRNHPEAGSLGKSQWSNVPGGLPALIDKVRASGDPPEASLITAVNGMFLAELARLPSDEARIAACRAELENPEDPAIFRKCAAMKALAAKAGPEAIREILPYLGHIERHLRETSEDLALAAAKKDQGAMVLKYLRALMQDAAGDEYSPRVSAALIRVLGDAGSKPSLDYVKQTLKHPDAIVRQAAAVAASKIGGYSEIPTLTAFLLSSKTSGERMAFEDAVLIHKDDEAYRQRVGKILRDGFSGTPEHLQPHLAWVLSQMGGEENLATVYNAIQKTENKVLQETMVHALSFSLDQKTDMLLLKMVGQGGNVGALASKFIVHRLVPANATEAGKQRNYQPLIQAVFANGYDHALANFLIDNQPDIVTMQALMTSVKSEMDSPPNKSRNPKHLDYYFIQQVIRCAQRINNPPEKEADQIAGMLKGLVSYLDWKIRVDNFHPPRTKTRLPWHTSRSMTPSASQYTALKKQVAEQLERFVKK